MDDNRLTELEAKVAELTATIERLRSNADEHTPAVEEEAAPIERRSSSRRGVLKLAGAAAGAAAIAVAARPQSAAAADGDPILIGVITNQSSSTTRAQTSAASGGAGFEFQTGSVYSPGQANFPCALAGWTETEGFPSGVYGYTETAAAGFGIVGWGEGPASSGAFLRGTKANALLEAAGVAGPSRTGAHVAGELIEDATGALWLCVKAGTPGTWRKLAGNETAGALHPIAQVRVYDSRAPQPEQGKLATGQSRVVSVKDARDPSGTVITANVVPVGATAVAGNITVTNTTSAGGGFLTIMPGDATAPAGSSVNWFGVGQNIANSFVAKLDANRELKVFAGGAPNPDTDFIIDISGFYL
jgi:hypothetical protein